MLDWQNVYRLVLAEASASRPLTTAAQIRSRDARLSFSSLAESARWLAAVALLLLLNGLAMALPEIPRGQSPRDFYDGFYPTEEWIQSLRLLPRDQRENPYQTVRIVDALPEDPRQRWAAATVKLTREDVAKTRKAMERFVRVSPEAYRGLVPRRNRIAGNQRVMPDGRVTPCPMDDRGLLHWYPDDPETIHCDRGHTVDPFALFPQTGVLRIKDPLGDEQDYAYHDTADGEKRIFLTGEYTVPLRMYALSQGARDMGTLYQHTGDIEYARRAAAILYDFARAIRHWPKVARGHHSGCDGADRFRPIDDYRVYAGIWYDKYHSGLGDSIPCNLACAYDLVATAPVWEPLDKLAAVGAARAAIENDLFLYSIRDAMRYDIHYPEPSSALSNYIPYQIRGLLAIGRAIGLPEAVHYAYWKQQQLARKTLMADGVFPESCSYARQHVYGLAAAAKYAEGYSDPPEFRSTVDGKCFRDLDVLRDLPELRRAIEALETMVYPSDDYMMIHDTYGRLVTRGHPAPPETRPLLYPSFGHAVLARGERDKANQIQAHLHCSGNWGHHHLDMLNFILWAYTDELISDIGYTHTYRQFATWTLGHNLVVVDRRYQEKALRQPGDLIAWHVPEGWPQVVEVSGAAAYKQCSTYRRALFLLPVGEMDNVVLDIFDVVGGNVHEWMAQGSCMVDGALEVTIPMKYHADGYADDGKPFTPPRASEYAKQRQEQGLNTWWLEENEKDPWYGVFRNVHKGRMTGPMEARFTYDVEGRRTVRLHVLSPTEADVYSCTVPSLRRCWTREKRGEDHSLVEKFRMPKLVIRRDGRNLRSRFVVLWEPTRGANVAARITDLAPNEPGLVALEIRTTDEAGGRVIRVFYSPDPSKAHRTNDGTEFRGRYGVVTRAAGATTAALYDVIRFKDGGLDVSVAARPALPVAEVLQLDQSEFAVELRSGWTEEDGAPLAGGWKDVTTLHPLVFDPPEHVILSQDGGSRRAFPVRAAEMRGPKLLLRCTRHPGFTYDRGRQTLKELFSPFNEVRGRAVVTLPSRVLLRAEADKPEVWRVRTTDPVRIGDRLFEPSDR